MDRYDPYTDKFIKTQPHTYRGVTLNDVMMYFDSLEGNEDAWTELCSCFECRGWELIRIQDGDARQDFLDIVYAELEDDPDNNRANRIIDAADEYAESAQLGTNLADVGTDCISRQAVIDALDEQIAQCNKALKSFVLSMKDEYAVKMEKASLVAFRERLEYLPPAQPEIIRCKDCAHYDGQWCYWNGHYLKDNDFCSRAERIKGDTE